MKGLALSSWREIFGFLPEDQPSYKLVYDRWRERVERHDRDQTKIDELKRALSEARLELPQHQGSDDIIHPEQLLPP